MGSKESMCRTTAGRRKTARLTLCPGDHADPGPAPVRARIGWAREDAKGLSMSIKLTDTQLVMLSAAAQRDDRCLVSAPKLKGAAAQKTAGKLIAAGLAKEIKAKAGMSVWRRDDEAGISYGLKLTTAGAKAIAIDESGVPGHVDDQGDLGEDVEQTTPSSQLEQSPSDPSRAANKNALRRLCAPRGGTKLAQVVELLQQDRGATINELIGATGWLPHTSRAALTGLRKRGFAVALDRSDKERGSIYRIEKDSNDRVATAPPTEAAEPNSEPASKKTHREANSKAHRAA